MLEFCHILGSSLGPETRTPSNPFWSNLYKSSFKRKSLTNTTMSKDAWDVARDELANDKEGLTVLKSIKSFLVNFKLEKPVNDRDAMQNIPIENHHSLIIERPYICNILKIMSFHSPTKKDRFWSIPRFMATDEKWRKQNIFQIQLLIGSRLDICKGCEIPKIKIRLHLAKSKNCKSKYSPEDLDELKENSEIISKWQASCWQKDHKEELSKKKAARYQERKDEVRKTYQGNKDEILKKNAMYYQRKRKIISYRRKNKRRDKQKMTNFTSEDCEDESEDGNSADENSEDEDESGFYDAGE